MLQTFSPAMRSSWRSWVIAVMTAASLFSPALIQAADAEPILLWPNGAPGAQGDDAEDLPKLRIYLPAAEKATGAGVVICPGGGYGALASDHEGRQVAQWFNQIGVAGFVLQYRLGPKYHHPAPLQDVQRALRYVRVHAKRFDLAAHRIGVIGFSAGGHLASTAATHFDQGEAKSADPVDRASCRPDFAILGYPVISMTEKFGHRGSKRNLLGTDPDPKLSQFLSSEKQVTKETPPVFFFHTNEDTGVPVENSLAFYTALRAAGVPAELHIYQFGPHGVGLGSADPVLFSWKNRLHDWLRGSGFLADYQQAPVRGKVTIDGLPLHRGAISFVPRGKPNTPVIWTRVSRGAYSIPAKRGAVVGMCQIEIRNLGAVAPQPTLDDVVLFTHETPQTKEPLIREVKIGENRFAFDLKTK